MFPQIDVAHLSLQFKMQIYYIYFVPEEYVLCFVYAMCVCVSDAAYIIHYERRSDDFVLHSTHNDYVLYAKMEEKIAKRTLLVSSISTVGIRIVIIIMGRGIKGAIFPFNSTFTYTFKRMKKTYVDRQILSNI